jgi:DNA helicase HerA-like ATPase
MAGKGAFFLGTTIDPSRKVDGERLTLDSTDLTTHGVIVGMTGSGKTGLGIVMIEEALLAGIPVLVLDPKGDMGNLALTFPDLSADEFRPWAYRRLPLAERRSSAGSPAAGSRRPAPHRARRPPA